MKTSAFHFDFDPAALGTTTPPDTAIPSEKGGEGGSLPDNVIPISAAKGGEGGEEVAPFTSFPTTNAEFIAEIFTDLPEGANPIVTGKPGDPAGGLVPKNASQVDRVCGPHLNTYFNCASIYPGEDGQMAAKLECAAAYHALVLDDVGTKVDRTLLGDITPTWSLETRA